MRQIQKLLHHDLYGPTIRYGMAGALVGIVYLVLPLLLKSELHLAIAAAIAIGYLVAVLIHFNLQRHFVFQHVKHVFQLTRAEQIRRYMVMGAVQYPVTLAATSLLPNALGVPERDIYVGMVALTAIVGFVVLRTAIFHPSRDKHTAHVSI